jgi:L-glutamine-phosphate cytidylyltransferase
LSSEHHTITKAIILSAGRGTRLGRLTQDRPKCLLDLAGQSLLEWQLDALAANGIEDVVVIVGFGAKRVMHRIANRPGVRTIYNPFYQVADNLASLWLARIEMDGDFLILNGDTLVSPEIIGRVLDGARSPITVTIDRKAGGYDLDDMKVELDGPWLRAIGKTLPPERSHAESIGLLAFRGRGVPLFHQAIEQAMCEPSGVAHWYLSVIDALAGHATVGTVSIEGMAWAEVDFPQDVAAAEAVATGLRRVAARRVG